MRSALGEEEGAGYHSASSPKRMRACGVAIAMTTADPTASDLQQELDSTRAALADAERQLAELRAARSAEMARLERQVYWLERWRIDLDALMSRRVVRGFVGLVGAVLRLAARLRGRA
jgi:hypothetical protein